MSKDQTTGSRKLVGGRWVQKFHIDRQEGLAWRLWTRFYGRRRWFIHLNAQLWNIRHG